MVNKLARITTGNQTVDRALDPIRHALNDLAGNASVVAGRLIGDTTLTNGAVNKLAHRLGHRLNGWIVVDLRGATATGRIVRVLSSGGATADDASDIWLDVQGMGASTVTARLWVF